MTDIEKFEQFFNEMGVSYNRSDDRETERPEFVQMRRENRKAAIRRQPVPHSNIPKADWLSVSQAHFEFDKSGTYVGVIADEMGYFTERKP